MTRHATRVDLHKLHEDEYAAARTPAIVKVGKGRYLTIDGKGAPGGEAFSAAVGALYGVAYTAKMTRKFAGKEDYAVGKLEAQWWAGAQCDFSTAPRDEWQWKLMIRTPDFVTRKDLKEAAAALQKRGKGSDAERVALESLSEGRCVQMLHVGPYEREAESIASMKAFAESKGLALQGRHHEIYLSDPRRAAPEKLKTILRVPVATSK